ncbi:MAG: hypothetical protein JWP31_2083 [Aeromicrobium sp.]|nr:hypothetical protein [Aeromicrobium sp.]
MTTEHLVKVYGTSATVCAPDGFPLDTEGAATDLLGEALTHRSELVVIPIERLTDDFFEITTGIAAEIAQKFETYRVRLAIVGDIDSRLDASPPLSAWVGESNRGTAIWFVRTFDDLLERLDRRKATRLSR